MKVNYVLIFVTSILFSISLFANPVPSCVLKISDQIVQTSVDSSYEGEDFFEMANEYYDISGNNNIHFSWVMSKSNKEQILVLSTQLNDQQGGHASKKFSTTVRMSLDPNDPSPWISALLLLDNQYWIHVFCELKE